MAGVNSMEFNQAASLLNAVMQQATGVTQPVATDLTSFVSLAQKTLQMGTDPVLNAISQVIDRTIFSIRGYNRKFRGLEADSATWGSITRKLSISDTAFDNNAAFALTDGGTVDQWTVKKANILQTNFYGANTFQLQAPSILRSQLNNAFRGPEEFMQFMTMQTQNILDIREQAIENCSRQLLCNYIAACQAEDANIIFLVTEYNDATDSNVTAETVYSEENFPKFARWFAGRLRTLSKLMTERSEEFQFNITGNVIMRHTPVADQKIYLYGPFMDQVNSRVYTDAFHDEYLKIADTEQLSYWQGIKDPKTINCTPTYTNSTGAVVTAANAELVDNVIGVMFDRNTMGYTIYDEHTNMTPINAKGDYSNIFHHFTQRWWTDFTEKGIVLMMA